MPSASSQPWDQATKNAPPAGKSWSVRGHSGKPEIIKWKVFIRLSLSGQIQTLTCWCQRFSPTEKSMRSSRRRFHDIKIWLIHHFPLFPQFFHIPFKVLAILSKNHSQQLMSTIGEAIKAQVVATGFNQNFSLMYSYNALRWNPPEVTFGWYRILLLWLKFSW